MIKQCVCGAIIPNGRSLCRECAEIYGTNPGEWPEWLRWAVSDIQRVHIEDLKHAHLRLEDIEPDGSGGYRAKRDFALRGCRTETHLYQDRNKNK